MTRAQAGQDWQSTAIWERLQELGEPAATVVAALQLHLPDIQEVLAHAGTSPRDFTLHDAEHSFRVAEHMWTIVPPDAREALNGYELGLLLLSAYLHDIGMTPQQGLVSAHHRLLVDGAAPPLPQAQHEAFQAWLDREHPGIDAVAPDAPPDEEARRAIDGLIADYVRFRHVDWSEQWIERHLELRIKGYPQAQEDLIGLCRSHQEGREELSLERFDPRFLRDGCVVHRRYLAGVLRVADVLDIDPERTPEIVFRHRDVSERSAIYWHKDHELVVTVEPDGRVIAEAFPAPRRSIARSGRRSTRSKPSCGSCGRSMPRSRSPRRRPVGERCRIAGAWIRSCTRRSSPRTARTSTSTARFARTPPGCSSCSVRSSCTATS